MAAAGSGHPRRARSVQVLLTKGLEMTKTHHVPVGEVTRHERDSSRPSGDPKMTGMAVSATLHCLTGCAIGEIAGLIIGATAGLTSLATIALSVALAFLFGYALSILPLLKAGMGLVAAGSVVLAADTLSIVTMEVVDNLVMVVSPGTMDAGLVNVIFWVGMALAFLTAFVVAVPVNRYLLVRGKGHALTHHHHQNVASNSGGWRTYIPNLGTSALVAALAAFMLGGLVVSAAAELTPVPTTNTPAADSSGH